MSPNRECLSFFQNPHTLGSSKIFAIFFPFAKILSRFKNSYLFESYEPRKKRSCESILKIMAKQNKLVLPSVRWTYILHLMTICPVAFKRIVTQGFCRQTNRHDTTASLYPCARDFDPLYTKSLGLVYVSDP